MPLESEIGETKRLLQWGSRYPNWRFASAVEEWEKVRRKKNRKGYRDEAVDRFIEEVGLAMVSWPDNLGLLFDWRHWVLPPRDPERPHEPPKPRIDLRAYVTSKDNLSLIWRPTDLYFRGPANHTDFSDFAIRHYDFQPYFERPENEIFFIRDIYLIDDLVDSGHYELAEHFGEAVGESFVQNSLPQNSHRAASASQ